MKNSKQIVFLFLSLIFCAASSFAQEDEYPASDAFVAVSEQPKERNLDAIKKAIGYPEVAVDAGLEGLLVFRILVSKDGQYVKHSVIKKGHIILQEAVEKHLKEIKFTPAIQNGKAIAFWINIPFRFKLLDTEPTMSLERRTLAVLNEAITEEPKNHILYLKRGLHYQTMSIYDSALLDLNQSIALNPKKNKKKSLNYPHLYYAQLGIGKVYNLWAKWEDAVKALDKAIAIAEETKSEDSLFQTALITPFLERGMAHARLENKEKAYKDFDFVIAKDDENKCLAYTLKYDLALSQDDNPGTINCLDNIIECERAAGNPLTFLFFNRAYYKMEMGDYATSIADFDSVLAMTNNYEFRVVVDARAGWALYKSGQTQAGIDRIQKAMDFNVVHPQPYYFLAKVKLEQGDKEAACKLIQKAENFGLQGEELEKAEALKKENCE